METVSTLDRGETTDRIAQSVIETLASHGVSRLTHRRVAATGGISLSTTTYHFRTKQEMVDHASHLLLESYVARFQAIARECEGGQRQPETLADLSLKILRNAAGKNRSAALAWGEIMLDFARTEGGRSSASTWYAQLETAWVQVARAFGEEHDELRIASMIDLTVGLLFFTRALGLDEAQIEAVANGQDLHREWKLDAATEPSDASLPPPQTDKAKATREQILQAAVDLLIAGGTGAVGYSAIARKSGVSMTAPAYHFGSISGLLKQAQKHMFAQSKDRYRAALSGSHGNGLSVEELADVTAAIFIREATQFSAQSLAHYSIWLEAARDDDLRPDVASAIGDQVVGWSRRLATISGSSPHNAILCQAMFVGALVRALATGAPTEMLARTRAQFLWLFTRIRGTEGSSTLFQKLLTDPH
ncbi:TetR/AcrR family transcriptional regulator [Alteraurantiacibacter aquimixticola]|uniref:TetR/AcrR family transcriptional regulator n=1 Tax=Alteraurantiacibacter aquimixticola TaxID=2489173 RepID=A0A4V4U8Y0_9SPHN|nr:TetR family transcriptional regulator [Alteraurantiacibacter aquimixticola]TIX51717.1 TetR/AcrR family transcriptional regulator [Alteraurantiacibacter aquimixticola]